MFGCMENIGKIIPGVWKFVSYDTSSGNLKFLLNHNQKFIEYSYLPSTFNLFYSNNLSKLFSFYFKKNRQYFKGFFKVLFIKQKGLCYKCKWPLNFHNIKLVHNLAYKFKENSISSLILHNYCYL